MGYKFFRLVGLGLSFTCIYSAEKEILWLDTTSQTPMEKVDETTGKYGTWPIEVCRQNRLYWLIYCLRREWTRLHTQLLFIGFSWTSSLPKSTWAFFNQICLMISTVQKNNKIKIFIQGVSPCLHVEECGYPSMAPYLWVSTIWQVCQS